MANASQAAAQAAPGRGGDDLRTLGSDPPVLAWSDQELPDAWPDGLSLRHVLELGRVAVRVLRGPHGQVTLPESLPGADRIPRYALQEYRGARLSRR